MIVLCFVDVPQLARGVVAVVPLAITSILCEALMVALGMGVKVATLPVIALGVGIGVDYALYLLSVQLAQQRTRRSARRRRTRAPCSSPARSSRSSASRSPPASITWAFSPIKFQADMGILLTFMFLWNMIGALVLIPALSHFLLPTERRARGRTHRRRPSMRSREREHARDYFARSRAMCASSANSS